MSIFARTHSNADRELLLDILRAHTAMVSAARSLDETLTQLVAGACKLARIPLGYGQLRVLDPETGRIRQDVQADGRHSRLGESVVVSRGLTGRAMRERTTLLVLDPARDPAYVPLYPDVRAELAIPLLQGAVCWGVLNLESPDQKRFTPDLVASLEVLAQQAVLTIQFDSYRRRETSHQLHEDVRAASEELVREVLRALPQAEATVEVQLLSADGEDLITIASATESALPVMPGSFGKGSTLAWQAVLTQTPVRRSHLALDDPRTSLQTTLAALVLPLRGRDGQVRGVLNVEVPERSRLNDERALAETEALLASYVEQAEAMLRAADERTLAEVTSLDAILSEIGRAIDRLTP
ncbi:MAG TPA: GAF domain-containing protein, partial [Ktedonobacterales bacterium]